MAQADTIEGEQSPRDDAQVRSTPGGRRLGMIVTLVVAFGTGASIILFAIH